MGILRDILATQHLSELEKIAKVSPYQQKTQWTCSAACFKAVLEHYGIPIEEEAAVQLIGARPGRGAEVTEIAEAARQYGLDAFEYSFDSLKQAKILLDQQIPIICDVQSWNHPGKGHYVVLVSMDQVQAHLMDPNTPSNQRTIPLTEMESRWWDHKMEPPHEVVHKWGIVILPQEAT
jgi:ABC-type bacteriocin/lantibiotic exporter with double-glycine peptidase domain